MNRRGFIAYFSGLFGARVILQLPKPKRIERECHWDPFKSGSVFSFVETFPPLTPALNMYWDGEQMVVQYIHDGLVKYKHLGMAVSA